MDIPHIAAILAQGGVALLPTDTVYGLAARPDRPEAIRNIFALKARPQSKSLPLLIADKSQLALLGVEPNARVEALLESQWMPGPLTLVLPINAARAPDWLTGRSEIAIRIPADKNLRALLRLTGPLATTSANASGQITPATPDAILRQITAAPDIIVRDGPRSGAASTLIDTQTTPFRLLRRGALPEAELARILAL